MKKEKEKRKEYIRKCRLCGIYFAGSICPNCKGMGAIADAIREVKIWDEN